MDKRKFNGGHKSAGRKPKVDEQKLIEKLSPLMPLAYKALEAALKDQEAWSVKLAMEYFYGKPKERKDINIKEAPTIRVIYAETDTDESSKEDR